MPGADAGNEDTWRAGEVPILIEWERGSKPQRNVIILDKDKGTEGVKGCHMTLCHGSKSVLI